MAIKNNVPVIPGTDGPVRTLEQARQFINSGVDYPVIIKASMGGGGRRMRVVIREEELEESFHRKTAFCRFVKTVDIFHLFHIDCTYVLQQARLDVVNICTH
ncbi:unnamed protein product [Albugo candida]|uniref:Carbamoyl phosphate synthase ATP-binding domain-containing protein n=1 Tax=Albugo candida TaxID=65357 RepID=A0A024FV45_9STRA|nr:unnamed protein product [Albugo candida]|eukprot:CCI10509.1 unnamed protein product [Albugo candida]